MFVSLALAAPADIDTPLRGGVVSPSDAAVVVGVEDYFSLPDVPHAERDATAFEDFLRYSRGVPPDRLQRLGAGANRERIRAAVEAAAAEASAGGTLWIYFAGHGAASTVDRERLVLGADAVAEARAFDDRGLSLRDLTALAAGSAADRVIVVLDTCYAGVGRDGTELLPGSRVAVPAWAVDPGPEVVVWSAASANELAAPYPDARHGAFTYFVVGALRGWADGELGATDGDVSLQEAEAFVSRSLRTVGARSQHPELVAPPAARGWVLAAALVRGAGGTGGVAGGRELAREVAVVGAGAPTDWDTAAELGRGERFAWTEDATLDTVTGLVWSRHAADAEDLWAATDRTCDAAAGWHVPSIEQLRALHAGSARELGQAFVLGAQAAASTTPAEGWPDLFLTLDPRTGTEGRFAATSNRVQVHCVRGDGWQAPRTTPPGRFRVVGAGSVEEIATGLRWTRRPAGFELPSVGAARAACERVAVDGRRGWRLPTRAEVEGLVEVRVLGPRLPDGFELGSSTLWLDDDPVRSFHAGRLELVEARPPANVVCVSAGDAVAAPEAPGAPPPAGWTTEPVVRDAGRFVRTEHVLYDRATGRVFTVDPVPTETVFDARDLACETLALDGGRWRLPTFAELSSLLEPEGSMPPWDDRALPGIDGVGLFTADPADNEAGCRTFGVRNDGWMSFAVPVATICIRRDPRERVPKPPRPTDASFAVDGGFVTDRRTRLVWRVPAVEDVVTRSEAHRACGELGDGFGLPTVEQLATLLEYGHGSPLVNRAVFPALASADYWTSDVRGSEMLVSSFGDGRVRSRGGDAVARFVCVKR